MKRSESRKGEAISPAKIEEYRQWLLDGNEDPSPEYIAESNAICDLALKGLASSETAAHTCDWSKDEDGVYHTGCGNAWFFETGTAEENRAKFCPFCGGGINSSSKGG